MKNKIGVNGVNFTDNEISTIIKSLENSEKDRVRANKILPEINVKSKDEINVKSKDEIYLELLKTYEKVLNRKVRSAFKDTEYGYAMALKWVLNINK